MKRLILIFLLFFLFPYKIYSATFPEYTGYVNDYAGIYTADFKNSLEQNLTDFEKNTGNEIAVAAVKTLEGESIDNYAAKLFEKWKIGKKGKDNGLLVLISKDDREVRIEVGYGLEGVINDARAGDIIRYRIIPEFKNGNYEKGSAEGIESIKSFLSDPAFTGNFPEKKSSSGFPFEPVIFIIAIFGSYIAGFLGRTKEIWPGAIIGGIIGGVGGLFVLSAAGFIIGFIIFGLIGLFLDFILSKNYKVRASEGKSTSWWNSGGGFSSGGGGWHSSSGSSGGFGGFGGGSSGGGGASGKW